MELFSTDLQFDLRRLMVVYSGFCFPSGFFDFTVMKREYVDMSDTDDFGRTTRFRSEHLSKVVWST